MPERSEPQTKGRKTQKQHAISGLPLLAERVGVSEVSCRDSRPRRRETIRCGRMLARQLLFAQHQYYEGIRQDSRPWMWLRLRGCGRRPELCGDGKNPVRLAVERHGAGSLLRGHTLGHGEFIRRILPDHRKHALAARGKCKTGIIVECCGIHALA